MEGSEPSLEEVHGIRFGRWNSDTVPFDPESIFTWRQYGSFLLGYLVFVIAKLLLISFAVMNPGSLILSLICMLLMMGVFLTPFLVWAVRKRKNRVLAEFKKWHGRHPEATGAPCILFGAYGGFGGSSDRGLARVEGSQLIYQGVGCEFRLQSSDLASSKTKRIVKFKYDTPVGTKHATLRFAGTDDSGWRKPAEAWAMIASDIEAWTRSAPDGSSIYPPLRSRRTIFPTGWWTRSVLVALLGLCLVAIVADWLRPIIFHWTIVEPLKGKVAFPTTGDSPLAPTSPLEWLLVIAAVGAAYLVVLGVGFAIRREWDRRNDRIDRTLKAA